MDITIYLINGDTLKYYNVSKPNLNSNKILEFTYIGRSTGTNNTAHFHNISGWSESPSKKERKFTK